MKNVPPAQTNYNPLLIELQQHTILLTQLVGMVKHARNSAQEEFISVGAASKILNKSPVTIRRWISENRIPAIRQGNSHYMIPKSVIEKIRVNGQIPFPVRV